MCEAPSMWFASHSTHERPVIASPFFVEEEREAQITDTIHPKRAKNPGQSAMELKSLPLGEAE
jgi:hypothetical protein